MLNGLAVLLFNALPLAARLIFASMGGLFSERSGVIDISLEGKMLSAACFAAWAGGAYHSALVGLGAGILAAVILSLLHWALTQIYQIDHVVSGMALNVIALGATNFINTKFLGAAAALPQAPKAQVRAEGAFSYISVYVFLAFLTPVLVTAYVNRTRGGLRLVAVGNAPGKARLAGLEPVRIRLAAALANGVLTGFAGVMIADNAGGFTDNMTAGSGYIALAALIIGGWRALPTLAACAAFGIFDALQIALQGVKIAGIQPPPELWQSVPYVAAVFAVAGFIKRSRPPAGIGTA